MTFVGSTVPTGRTKNDSLPCVEAAEVYLLTLHEPYEDPAHPVPLNATIVHSLTMLNKRISQPDGGAVYRCLTEFPGRHSGMIVPLSTLTYELDGGALWPYVADWEAVCDGVVALARYGGCDALRLRLSMPTLAVLSQGPVATLRHISREDGSVRVTGRAERQRELQKLELQLREMVAEGPFWPGEPLTAPPLAPAVMPYRPFKR
jgi:hypothetical protein